MYNDFVIVGPAADPAKVASRRSAREAFSAIAIAQAPFASRGDKSGTHTAELALWASAKVTPSGAWYRSLGQGMGETLIVANEQRAYTMSDRGTWLSMREKLPDLRVLLGGRTITENPDSSLRNRYGVMAINPDTHPGVNDAGGAEVRRVADVAGDPAGDRRLRREDATASRSSIRTRTNGKRPTR